MWLSRQIQTTATKIAQEVAKKSFDNVFKANLFEKVKKDGLGFSDAIFFTPYYFVSGVYLPAFNLIAETAVIIALVTVFTIYKPVIFFLLAGILGTAFLLVHQFTRKKISALGAQHRQAREQALEEINYGISGFTDIKTHQAMQYFQKRFAGFFQNFSMSGTKSISYQLWPARINELAALCGIIILVIYAYFYNRENTGEVRVIAAIFALSAFRLIPAANRLLNAIMHFKMNAYTVEHLEDILQNRTDAINHIQHFEQSIEIEKLAFTYNTDSVFSEAQITINKGQWIGIAGNSGSGKTTFAKIILGLLPSNHAQILLDGKVISNFNELQSLFAFVSQEPYFFNGTVAENIAFGNPSAMDNQRLLDCLKQAAFYAELPENQWLGMPIAPNGTNLSVGQKQRVAIARALYHQTEIIIFDEPSAALDDKTEQQLMEGLIKLKELNKTVLLIAHRHRMFELCDVVYRIENKKLVTAEKE